MCQFCQKCIQCDHNEEFNEGECLIRPVETTSVIISFSSCTFAVAGILLFYSSSQPFGKILFKNLTDEYKKLGLYGLPVLNITGSFASVELSFSHKKPFVSHNWWLIRASYVV